MGDAASVGLRRFVKKNFRPLKVKGVRNILIGRRTYKWALQELNKNRLSRLTQESLDETAQGLELKIVEFDDGNIYYVYPPAEREILVDFFTQIEEMEGEDGTVVVKDAAPVLDDDLLDNYRISDAAVLALTGESVEDLELSSESVIDFITNEMIELALDDEQVKVYVDDGVYTIIMFDQDMPERETYPLHLERLLPGTEVSLEELGLPQKTKITGIYRDQPGVPKEDM